MIRLGQLLRRAYVRPRDIPIWKHDMMVSMVANFINCRQHLDFLKTNDGQIPPKVLADQLNYISRFNLDLDEHWPEICKHVKVIIEDYGRLVIPDFSRIIRSVAELGETNQEFWDLIEAKLVKDNLVRYLSESEAAKIMWGLCKVGKGSDELWKKLEKEVANHYLALEKEDLAEAIYALEVSGKGDKNVIFKLKSRMKATELALVN